MEPGPHELLTSPRAVSLGVPIRRAKVGWPCPRGPPGSQGPEMLTTGTPPASGRCPQPRPQACKLGMGSAFSRGGKQPKE